MRIYLAGPISGKGYEETVRMFARLGYEVLHPMLGKEHLRNEVEFRAKDYRHPISTNHAIYERDQWMVRQSDIVFADLSTATEVSQGTDFELAWASLLGKHTVVVMGEDSPHQHAFVLEAADIIFPTTQEAIDYLIELADFRPTVTVDIQSQGKLEEGILVETIKKELGHDS